MLYVYWHIALNVKTSIAFTMRVIYFETTHTHPHAPTNIHVLIHRQVSAYTDTNASCHGAYKQMM